MKRLLALALCAYSAPSFAIFDAQATVGKRWYSFAQATGTKGISSQEVAVSAHLSPIPLVPVGIGAIVNVGSPSKGDISTPAANNAALFQAGVDITAWFSLLPILTPFVRLSYLPISTYAYETGSDLTKQAVKGSLTGYHLNAGAKFNFLPLVKLTLEAGTAGETFKMEELKTAGVAGTKDPDRKVDSKSLALGVEVGI